MALGERTAAGVLTGQTNEFALARKRTEREKFAESPVDLAVAGHLATFLRQRSDTWVEVESLGRVGKDVADSGNFFLGN